MVRPGGGAVLPARASAPRWVPRTEASSVAAAVTATVGFRARKGTQLIYVVVRRLYTPFFCLFLVSCFFFLSVFFTSHQFQLFYVFHHLFVGVGGVVFFRTRGVLFFISPRRRGVRRLRGPRRCCHTGSCAQNRTAAARDGGLLAAFWTATPPPPAGVCVCRLRASAGGQSQACDVRGWHCWLRQGQ